MREGDGHGNPKPKRGRPPGRISVPRLRELSATEYESQRQRILEENHSISMGVCPSCHEKMCEFCCPHCGFVVQRLPSAPYDPRPGYFRKVETKNR